MPSQINMDSEKENSMNLRGSHDSLTPIFENMRLEKDKNNFDDRKKHKNFKKNTYRRPNESFKGNNYGEKKKFYGEDNRWKDDRTFHPHRKHEFSEPDLSKVSSSNSSTTTAINQNPFCFQISPKDLFLCQKIADTRNRLYANRRMDPEVYPVLNRTFYEIKEYLYMQQSNLSQFYEDKRKFELSQLQKSRNPSPSMAPAQSSQSVPLEPPVQQT